jgi:hypothetical protein
MQKHTLELFADYSQFLLSDEDSHENFETFWTESTHHEKLAVGDNVIGVRTIEPTGVIIDVEVHDSPPELDDTGQWYQIAECSLDIPSGKLVVMGVTDFFPEAKRIVVDPGTYRIRIHYGNQDSGHATSSADEYYLAVLWKGTEGPVTFIKRSD